MEFIYEAIAVLESDLIMISANGVESLEDIAAFKLRYPFAFQGAPPAAAGSPTEQPHAPEPEVAGDSRAETQDVAQNAAHADRRKPRKPQDRSRARGCARGRAEHTAEPSAERCAGRNANRGAERAAA